MSMTEQTTDEMTARRVALGHTRKDAATLSGVKESAIRSIETGVRPHGGDETVSKYKFWLIAAEARAAKNAIPIFNYPAKAFGAEPVLDDNGVQVPGMWLTPDRGLGRRYVMEFPDVGPCAGWEPGRTFMIDGEPGTFRFQRLTVHATTGVTSVDAFGGTSGNSAFRSFRPERVAA